MKRVFLLLLISSITIFANPSITVYNAYSNGKIVYINGRLIKEDKIKANKQDSIIKNLLNKAKLLFHDELQNSMVFALINGKHYSAKSDNEGYFNFTIKENSDKAVIYTSKENGAKETGILRFNRPKIGIISDFDDTLAVSNVPNKIKLAINTLTKNYKQRVLIKITAKKIKKILKKHPNAPFIIVSGSPYQLYEPIKNFLAYHNFPKPIILLKQVHGDNKESNDQFRYKVDKIEKIFNYFPSTRWYLFGDSGEKDVQVYQYFKKRYPERVLGVFIETTTQ